MSSSIYRVRFLSSALVLIVSLFLLSVRQTAACSCFPEPLDVRACAAALVVRATVLFASDTCGPTRTCNETRLSDQADGRRVYVARVSETFRGTAPKDDILFIRTALLDAQCGAGLSIGVEYVLTIRDGADLSDPMPAAPVALADAAETPVPLESSPPISPPAPDAAAAGQQEVAIIPAVHILAGVAREQGSVKQISEQQQTACAFPWSVFPMSLCDFPTEWIALTDSERAMLNAVKDDGEAICADTGTASEPVAAPFTTAE